MMAKAKLGRGKQGVRLKCTKVSKYLKMVGKRVIGRQSARLGKVVLGIRIEVLS